MDNKHLILLGNIMRFELFAVVMKHDIIVNPNLFI